MKYRKLGNCTDDISAIGLGGMAMTSIYGPADEGEAIATVHAALDAGMNFIDTSDAYGGGKNEEMLAAIATRRSSRPSSAISAVARTDAPNMLSRPARRASRASISR